MGGLAVTLRPANGGTPNEWRSQVDVRMGVRVCAGPASAAAYLVSSSQNNGGAGFLPLTDHDGESGRRHAVSQSGLAIH